MPEPYTPTTEIVRRDYAAMHDEYMYSPSIAKAREYRENGGGAGEFDRWLSAYTTRIREEAWEQGKSAWARYEMACEDAASSGQGHIVSQPKNPWSEIPEGQAS